MKSLFILLWLLLLTWIGCGKAANPQGTEKNVEHRVHQLACQAPPRDAFTGKLIKPSTPIYRDSFSPREAVWVAINPDISDSQKKDARLYVVQHTGEIGDDDLTDVIGEYEEIKIPQNSSGTVYIPVWESPSVREEGYDLVVDFPPLGEYNKGKDIVDGITQKGFIVPRHWVYLESISFNYDKENSDWDAISIRRNLHEAIQVEEWRNGISYPAAYLKNRVIQISAKFLASPLVRKAYIGTQNKEGPLGIVCPEVVEFNKTSNGVCNRGGVVFSVEGRTPAKIIKEYQHWRWHCKPNISIKNENSQFPEILHVGDSLNKIFVILAPPQTPWYQGEQMEPWSEVLDLSCTWAIDETTPEGAAAKISQKLYNSSCFSYSSSPYFTDRREDSFDLSKFIDDFTSFRNVIKVNCADMAKALVTFSNAIGCGLSYWEISQENGSMQFNCIKPIGRCRICNYHCKYHAIGGIEENVNGYFDPSFKEAPEGRPPELMRNVSIGKYQTKMIQSPNKLSIIKHLFPIKMTMTKTSDNKIPIKAISTLVKEYNRKTIGSNGRIIAGVAISDKILNEITDFIEIVENENFCIKKIRGSLDEFVTISKVWNKNGQFNQLNTTMVVGPSFEAVLNYLIFHHYNGSGGLPESKIKKGIGNIYLPLESKRIKNFFSQVEFIRHNVLIIMKANGYLGANLEKMAKELDKRLSAQIPVNEYQSLGGLPIITVFRAENDEIELGEKTAIQLKTNGPKGLKKRYFWEMTGGAIEKESADYWIYYSGDLGIHKVTITVINEIGLYNSKSLTIKIKPRQKKQ